MPSFLFDFRFIMALSWLVMFTIGAGATGFLLVGLFMGIMIVATIALYLDWHKLNPAAERIGPMIVIALFALGTAAMLLERGFYLRVQERAGIFIAVSFLIFLVVGPSLVGLRVAEWLRARDLRAGQAAILAEHAAMTDAEDDPPHR